jgi:hypothetical protein
MVQCRPVHKQVMQISACAPHAQANTLSGTAGTKGDLGCQNEESVRQEHPRWAQGFLWSEQALSLSPSAAATECADPLPSVLASVCHDHAAAQTIAHNPSLFRIITPINLDRFESLLSTHPNCHPLVDSVCRSFREGVWPFATINSATPATFDFPTVMSLRQA